MPGPGRSTESRPTGAGPGTRPAGATARRPAPGTLGGGGETGVAGHEVTCEPGGPLNRDTHSTPERPERQIRFSSNPLV